MVKHYLDFEKPLIELEREIDHLEDSFQGETDPFRRLH